jgi:cytochrome P450
VAVEGNNVLAAGFETTGAVLTLMTYLLLEHSDIYEKLKRELVEAIPDPEYILSWQDLEKLPVLSGVVKESLW